MIGLLDDRDEDLKKNIGAKIVRDVWADMKKVYGEPLSIDSKISIMELLAIKDAKRRLL